MTDQAPAQPVPDARAQQAGKLLPADEYAARHDAHADFESVCLLARQQHNLRVLAECRPRRVLEVGCGPELLSVQALAQGLPLSRWVVVEPATRYADAARTAARTRPSLVVVQGYVETVADALAPWLSGPEQADLVIVSGVIHETQAPEALLAAALAWLRPGGHIWVSVPNALSFHRLLAVEMGLMDRPEALSERNQLLGQPQVFSPEGLQGLLKGLGLVVERLEGTLFKPFTHAQMAGLMPQLGPTGVQGLIELGRRFPQQAAEIGVLARKPGAG